MKKILICAMILIISAQSFSQGAEFFKPVTKADFLLKSKRQKTTAWVFLGIGVPLTTIGLVKGIHDHAFDIINFGKQPSSSGPVMTLLGLGSTLTGFILFSSSKNNYKRAMKASALFKMETAPIIQKSSFVQTSFPALSVRIDLK